METVSSHASVKSPEAFRYIGRNFPYDARTIETDQPDPVKRLAIELKNIFDGIKVRYEVKASEFKGFNI